MQLKTPPIVSQLWTKLPDGKYDPSSQVDCGEAVTASALAGFGGPLFSPGCIREAMALPTPTSLTTAQDLATFATKTVVPAKVFAGAGNLLWARLAMLEAHGHYMALLGDWLASGVGHWVLAYHRTPSSVLVMGPYDGEYEQYSNSWVSAHAWDTHVIYGD